MSSTFFGKGRIFLKISDLDLSFPLPGATILPVPGKGGRGLRPGRRQKGQKMKKIVLLFVLSLSLLLAACGSAAPAAQQPAAEAAEEIVVEEALADGQNPVMNFVGVYAPEISAAAKPQMLVECKGADSAAVTVMWPVSNGEVSCWTMTGKLDAETLTVDYTDGVHKTLVYGEDGKIASETGIYENGKGRVSFHAEDNTVVWIDEQDHTADELIFAFVVPQGAEADDPAFYSAFSAMEKGLLESYAQDIRQAFLDENWDFIADLAHFPILVNGVEYADRDAFLAFMSGCTLSDTARSEMEQETCHDMFYNGQGLCLGGGQVWLLDYSYMSENEPDLRIISLNDIVEK